ncbi:antitoxin [Mycolicibacterium conceptionense]|uniref:Antitoxin n=4 Tax=Mycolicibacterium TaxID=1866885 RepID=A0A0J8UEI3_9MYCO|nr:MULTISPECIES: ribbon-helix-helix protein, CopG family [Mycolicibacterium]OCB47942.1 antitoxin [Mycolicibacterium vulneris]KLI05387.1 antitoxin [Mycolicibacterium senegalense]KLO54463.1 antitoxin [Mycolicibacterium senegalense]KMV19372.1 antitoxin [Mycolicibacterium conceptionense]MCV7200625.1 ribbon-helix-helix protein, CopG family [Mycolicibacterium peregrinum]
MGKAQVWITLDRDVLAAADVDAQAAGLNRSELVEQALRHEHLRITLEGYAATTVRELHIDDYAHRIYRINRASDL